MLSGAGGSADPASVSSPSAPNAADSSHAANAPANFVPPASAGDATRAKAAFQETFEKYKNAIREIERKQAEYQTATPEQQKKLNEEVTGDVANADSAFLHGAVLRSFK